MSIVEIICDSEHNADELHNALKANTFEVRKNEKNEKIAV